MAPNPNPKNQPSLPPATLQAESVGCRSELRVRITTAGGKTYDDLKPYLAGTRVELVGMGKAVEVVETRVFGDTNEAIFSSLPAGPFNIRIAAAPGVKVTGALFNDGAPATTKATALNVTKGNRISRVTLVPPYAATLDVEAAAQTATLKCFAYVDLDCACDRPADCECEKPYSCGCDQPTDRQQPIEGVSITLRKQGKNEQGKNDKCASTDSHGQIVFNDVTPGLYEVFPCSTVKGTTGDEAGCTYHVAYNAPIFVELSAGQSCCTLPIRYCLDESSIFVSACIDGRSECCEPEIGCDAEFLLFCDGDRQFSRYASCHHHESAVFSGLPAGTYTLVLQSPFVNVKGEDYQLRSPQHGAIRVALCAGQNIDLRHHFRFVRAPESQRAMEISGRVTDSGGQGAAYQQVDLLQAKTERVLWTAATDTDGLYRVLWHHWRHQGEVELRIGKTRVRVPKETAILTAATDTTQLLQS